MSIRWQPAVWFRQNSVLTLHQGVIVELCWNHPGNSDKLHERQRIFSLCLNEVWQLRTQMLLFSRSFLYDTIILLLVTATYHFSFMMCIFFYSVKTLATLKNTMRRNLHFSFSSYFFLLCYKCDYFLDLLCAHKSIHLCSNKNNLL